MTYSIGYIRTVVFRGKNVPETNILQVVFELCERSDNNNDNKASTDNGH